MSALATEETTVEQWDNLMKSAWAIQIIQGFIIPSGPQVSWPKFLTGVRKASFTYKNSS